jgi:hypothetical protein
MRKTAKNCGKARKSASVFFCMEAAAGQGGGTIWKGKRRTVGARVAFGATTLGTAPGTVLQTYEYTCSRKCAPTSMLPDFKHAGTRST